MLLYCFGRGAEPNVISIELNLISIELNFISIELNFISIELNFIGIELYWLVSSSGCSHSADAGLSTGVSRAVLFSLATAGIRL